MKGTLALATFLGAALAACAGDPNASLSPLASGLNLLPIAEQIRSESSDVDCGAPGGGGGSMGAGPHGEPLAHHEASLVCRYPDGTLDQLAAAWGRATGTYIESLGVRITMPGSSSGENRRGLTWEYAFGAATGVLTISIVPVGDDSFAVLANVVEFAAKG